MPLQENAGESGPPFGDDAFADFLAGSRNTLLGTLDSRGVVLSANRALRRWIPEAGDPRLTALLAASSARKLRSLLAELERTGQSKTVSLTFRRGRPMTATYRCL